MALLRQVVPQTEGYKSKLIYTDNFNNYNLSPGKVILDLLSNLAE